MLTDKPLFAGETVSDTLAQVLTKEPGWEQVPAKVRRLLEACLQKDPKQRLQAIGDWRLLLTDVQQQPQVVAPSRSWIGIAGWIAAAVIAGAALWGWFHPVPTEPRNVVRLTTTLPVVSNVPGAIVISHDGTRLAFVSHSQIYVRMLDQLEARPIPGTEGASFLCFSPDGQWISYMDTSVQPNKLKRIAVEGGPAQVLADADTAVGPPTQDWGPDDNILFTSKGALMRIPAAGGTAQILGTPAPKKGEIFYLSPRLLPG